MQGLKAYVGNQRSGKSYSAVLDIVDDLLPSGGTYYGNIAGLSYEILSRVVEKRHGVCISQSQFHPLASSEIADWVNTVPDGQTLDGYNASIGMFIDEVHLFFNALKRGANLLQVADRMCQLGKTGIALRIIAPNYKQIDTQLRNQIQEIWLHRDCRQLSVIRYAGKVIPPVILQIQMSIMDGKATGERNWIWKEQEIFDCYKSFGVQFQSTRGTVGLARMEKTKKAKQMQWIKRGMVAASLMAGVVGCREHKAAQYEAQLKALVAKAETSVSRAVVANKYIVATGVDDEGQFALMGDGVTLRVGSIDSDTVVIDRIFPDRVEGHKGDYLVFYSRRPRQELNDIVPSVQPLTAKQAPSLLGRVSGSVSGAASSHMPAKNN